MGGTIPGPMCSERCGAGWIDDGTLCLFPSPLPGSLGVQLYSAEDALDDAISALEATALNFGLANINDASVRENYMRNIRRMADEVMADVRAGRATAEEGAQFANQMRNRIMDEARARTSSFRRAGAEQIKSGGKALERLINEKAAELFPGKSFASLETAQRRQVFEAIIESSGKSRPSVSARITRWRVAGRGLVIFTVAISAYNVWTAENKVQAGLKEGIVLGSGVAGGALAGAATGLVCGPGAPICSTALFVVGGIMGALAGTAAAEYYDEELLEFAKWLGEGF